MSKGIPVSVVNAFIGRWDRQQRILDRIAALCLVAA